MKKFEELERIQQEFSTLNVENKEQASGSSHANPEENKENIDLNEDEEMSEASSNVKAQFTQEQLEEVFKRTSAFTVRSATIDTSLVEDMDALDLWQVEYKENNTSEFYEEE